MERTERFLDLYRQLEQSSIEIYGFPSDGTAISRLEKLPYLADLRAELKYCREVRALLSHNPKVDGDFAVEPSEGMSDLLESILSRLSAPQTCMQIAKDNVSLLTTDANAFVMPLLREMNEKGYSHVPVLNEDGTVRCVFSENLLVKYLLGKNPIFNAETRIRHIVRSVSWDNRNGRYRFLASSAPVSDAEALFGARFRKNERIQMVFLTEHGSPDEPMLGLLTPWDVMGT